jgi:hypothetical protein
MIVARISAAALAALALGGGASASESEGSGLFGVVRRGPITPVCVAERPCSAPAAGVSLVFARGSREIARAKSGRDGSYRVSLAAGLYRVRGFVNERRRVLKPVEVRVPAGRVARVNFMLDTGIR